MICDTKGQANEKILKPKLQRRLRRNPTDAGFKVLRFWSNVALRDIEAVRESIWMALQERCAPSPSHPHPDLPLEGEGVFG